VVLAQQMLTACVHTFEGPALGSRLPRSRLSPMTRRPLPSLRPLPAVSLMQARWPLHASRNSGKVLERDETNAGGGIRRLHIRAFPRAPKPPTLTSGYYILKPPLPLPTQPRAAAIRAAISTEVERLRAAGLKGVHRIRVGDKDYDIDIDTYNTYRDSCELLTQFVSSAFGVPSLLFVGFAARGPPDEGGGLEGC
jgi:hypothetical protein